MTSIGGAVVLVSLVVAVNLVVFTRTSQISNTDKDEDELPSYSLFEGDILLDLNNAPVQDSGMRRKRAMLPLLADYLWEDGIVIYEFSTSQPITSNGKRVMLQAMRHIEDRTCIRFQEKVESDENFVEIQFEKRGTHRCYAFLGRLKVKGKQPIYLNPGCNDFNSMVHELGHTLGLHHEQSRPDRNKYIEIVWNNVHNGGGLSKLSYLVTRGYPYDYNSVMHYSSTANSRAEGQVTIKVKDKGRTLGAAPGKGLSSIDVAKIRDLYKCNVRHDDKLTTCDEGWTKRRGRCYKIFSTKNVGFGRAQKQCLSRNSHLIIIDNEREQNYLNRYLSSNFGDVLEWRTAGKKVKGKMVWYKSEIDNENMAYTNWSKAESMPFSSLILKWNEKDRVFNWVTEKTTTKIPFICEKPAKRKCFPLSYADGRDYRGTRDYTKDLITCQKWTENYPRENAFLHAAQSWANLTGNQDNNGLGDHNYCRNPPDSSGKRKDGPWCYTTKRRDKWQYCNISSCPKIYAL